MISLSETICVLSRVYTPWAYTRACARIRRLSAQLFILLSPVAPSAYASIRRVSPLEFKHVELSRPAQTSTVFPANHESTPRSPRADALFCIGTYVDVYRRISSRVYTFIHGTTFAMQWRRPGKRKRRQLHRLPAHTRAGSINPALHENQPCIIYRERNAWNICIFLCLCFIMITKLPIQRECDTKNTSLSKNTNVLHNKYVLEA